MYAEGRRSSGRSGGQATSNALSSLTRPAGHPGHHPQPAHTGFCTSDYFTSFRNKLDIVVQPVLLTSITVTLNDPKCPVARKMRFQDVMPDGTTNLSEATKNGIFHLMQFYFSDILRYVAVCNIVCYYESYQPLSNDAETGDLERRMWLRNVRKLFQPRMSDTRVCCAF